MIIQSKELLKLLQSKSTLVDEGRAITKEIEKLETDRRKVGLQIQKMKDKIIPLVKKLTDGKLGEYEEISTVEPKGDEIIVETVDVVEDFKKQYKEAKKAQETTPETK
jgi:DNA anti-recombination protein RmuC